MLLLCALCNMFNYVLGRLLSILGLILQHIGAAAAFGLV